MALRDSDFGKRFLYIWQVAQQRNRRRGNRLLRISQWCHGRFMTTTGEAPGTNRREIAAERGRVVIKNGKIQRTRMCSR